MSNFALQSVTAPPPVQAAPPATSPQPPKSQSDHKPANPSTSSRGPAVVLSGALAKPTDRQGSQSQTDTGSSSSQGQGQGQTQAPPQTQSQSQTQASGQHINHVI